jgi:CubicO group peptidase (beta-lactamase class C family)
MSKSGLSKKRLALMHDVLAGYVERGEYPGFITLVSRHGVVHVDVIGKQAVDGASMQRDSIFRISSMTKPVAAAAAMILVEECNLRLDEPVDRLLPELANRKVLRTIESEVDDTVPARRPITVRDLLTFRLGHGMLMTMPGAYPVQRYEATLELGGMPAPQYPPPPDEWLRRFATIPLYYQPGDRWLYNTGSEILGILIARASGQSLEGFMRERIFEPLGMKDTGFVVPAEKMDRFTTNYLTSWETGAREVYDAPDGQWAKPPRFPSAAAGLVSTVDDFVIFGQMMLNKGIYDRKRILSRLSVETMTTDQLTPAQKAVSGLVDGYFESHGWGFGMGIATRRDDIYNVPGRYGWDGGLGTSWYSDPAEDMVTILMTPLAWSSPEAPPAFRDFWTLAYQAIDD